MIIVSSVKDYEFLTGSLPKDTGVVRQKLHLVMFGVREGQPLDIPVVAQTLKFCVIWVIIST